MSGTPHAFRGPLQSSTDGSKGKVCTASPRPCRHNFRALRGPRRCSTKSLNGRARMAPPANIGAPLALFVDPEETPPTASTAGSNRFLPIDLPQPKNTKNISPQGEKIFPPRVKKYFRPPKKNISGPGQKIFWAARGAAQNIFLYYLIACHLA